MNRTLRLVLCAAMAGSMMIGAAGCATAKKKFTRKKDTAPVRPVIFTEKEFVKPYTNEYYYGNNYNLWKVWHEELVNAIGGNTKLLTRSGDEAVARLLEMQTYLEEPKHSELGEQIDQLKRAVETAQSGRVDAQAKFQIDKTYRIIRTNFFVDDVKPWLKKDEIVL